MDALTQWWETILGNWQKPQWNINIFSYNYARKRTNHGNQFAWDRCLIEVSLRVVATWRYSQLLHVHFTSRRPIFFDLEVIYRLVVMPLKRVPKCITYFHTYLFPRRINHKYSLGNTKPYTKLKKVQQRQTLRGVYTKYDATFPQILKHFLIETTAIGITRQLRFEKTPKMNADWFSYFCTKAVPIVCFFLMHLLQKGPFIIAFLYWFLILFKVGIPCLRFWIILLVIKRTKWE